jgi:DNA polymerase-1
MLATAIGWLGQLLTPPMPACLAAALDSIGPTWRHELTASLPEGERYKATRSARPSAYRRALNLFLEILTLHGVPLLCAQGYEADDVIATATGEALALGLDVAIVSGDKDLGALVYRDLRSVWQWAWSGTKTASDIRGPAEIVRGFGVLPRLVPDFLAIVGDVSDNVPGVDGVGDVWAAKVLALADAYRDQVPAPTLIAAMMDMQPKPPTDDAIGLAEKEHARLKRAKPNALSDEAVRRREQQIAEAKARLDGLRHQRDLAKRFEMVQRSRETVLLARELVTLRTDAPILGWDPARLPIGGFDVEALRDLYRSEELGWFKLAAELRPMNKRQIEEILSK